MHGTRTDLRAGRTPLIPDRDISLVPLTCPAGRTWNRTAGWRSRNGCGRTSGKQESCRRTGLFPTAGPVSQPAIISWSWNILAWARAGFLLEDGRSTATPTTFPSSPAAHRYIWVLVDMKTEVPRYGGTPLPAPQIRWSAFQCPVQQGPQLLEVPFGGFGVK